MLVHLAFYISMPALICGDIAGKSKETASSFSEVSAVIFSYFWLLVLAYFYARVSRDRKEIEDQAYN